MQFTSQPIGIYDKKLSPVVIDWSGNVTEQNASDENIDKMIEWIKTYPRRSDIHVYLGKAKQRQVGRRLQGALQALGCKVTTKQFSPAV